MGRWPATLALVAARAEYVHCRFGWAQGPQVPTLTHTHTHSHTLYHTHTLSHTLTHTHTLSLTHTLYHTHSHTPTHTLSHTHTHTHIHTHTHTHTYTHTHTHKEREYVHCARCPCTAASLAWGQAPRRCSRSDFTKSRSLSRVPRSALHTLMLLFHVHVFPPPKWCD